MVEHPHSPERMLNIHDLCLRLEEAKDILEAIRRGDVDALVVNTGDQEHVFALKGADHVYHVLFGTLNEGALVLGPNETILYANPRFAETIGLSLEALWGCPLCEFVLPEDRASFGRLLEAGRQAKSRGQIRLQRADRRAVPVMVSVSGLDLEGGADTCVAVISDLSDLLEAQEALAKANAELEARVAKRTAELLEEIAERKRAEARLREADRRKDEFLAMLAHELRNPLASIQGAVELMQRIGSPEPRLVRAREIVARQVSQQARLVDDLLDVSRISHGQIVLQRERLDLTHLLREAAEDRGALMEQTGVDFTLELPEAPVWVDGDRARLSQVVDNLLTNAAKFTDAGGQVTVRLAVTPPEAWATITVRDTGIGITAEMLPQVFETFTQADRSLDRSRGGMGLGLALVKGLVELHGGEVAAHSDGAGRGAAFTLRLPTAPAPAPAAERSARAEPRPRTSRVLIVEDNPDAAETLRELLELAGCEVEVAYSGEAAIEAAGRLQPEVVLCDLGLPGMDGFAVAAELRQEPGTAGARLIALTGYGQHEDQRRSRAAGFDFHLTKPVRFEQLERLLEVSPEGREA